MNRFRSAFKALSIASLAATTAAVASATSLSIGADYQLRGVSIKEREKTFQSSRYYDQRIQPYLITDLSEDVEATVRLQSITVWGLEGSTTSAPSSRYPKADGTPWVQNAFIRMPNLWKNRLTLTLGRQPITWGDGLILSDDDLGFNAIRVQSKSPWKWLPADIELFTAKISDKIKGPGDTDLHGAQLGVNLRRLRWEIMLLQEKSDAIQAYQMGAETAPVNASHINRRIIGARFKTTVKDAFFRGEYYIQSGDIRRQPAGNDFKLGGTAYSIGIGGASNTEKWGRFSTVLETMASEGDKPGTPGKDEAFRATYASRWDGLERKGYGRYLAATLSDVYSSTNPFAAADSTNTGLPIGTSGIQSYHFGFTTTPWAKWTFGLDYYQYKAQKRLSGNKELGTEFDYSVQYRYSGLLQFRAVHAVFNPGEAYQNLANTHQKASRSDIEALLRF